MRVTEERIRLLATAVVDRLQERRILKISASKKRLIDAVRKAVTDELSMEDQLHAEKFELSYDGATQSLKAAD